MMARRLAAGFLAGASGVASFFTLLLLLFFISGVGTLMSDIAGEVYGNIPFGEIFWLAFWQMLATMPRYYWGARWGILALGGLGIVLALVDMQSDRIRRPWRRRLGLIATVGIIIGMLVGLDFAGRAGAAALRGLNGVEMLCLWSVVGLAAALPIWVVWSWWYSRWLCWLHAPRRWATASGPHGGDTRRTEQYAQDAAGGDAPGATAVTRRLPSQSRPYLLLLGLAGATLLPMLVLRLYDGAANGPPALAATALVGLAAGLWAATLLVVVFELAIATNWSDETLHDE